MDVNVGMMLTSEEAKGAAWTMKSKMATSSRQPSFVNGHEHVIVQIDNTHFNHDHGVA